MGRIKGSESFMGLYAYVFWVKELLHPKASVSSSHKQKVEKQLSVWLGVESMPEHMSKRSSCSGTSMGTAV